MSVTAVARRYAEAMADSAIARGQLDKVQEELKVFADLISGNRELRETYASPIVSMADKTRVLDAILDRTKPSELTSNLLRLMLKHYRLHHLDVVYRQFEREVNKRKGIVIAEVTTAAPVGSGEQDQLRGRLAQLVGKQVQIQFKTDPSLIGGAVTRIESVVYDGSIRTQLQEIKQRLKEGASGY